MYIVSKKTKELYRKDAPEVNEIPRKQLALSFSGGLKIENAKIHSGSFSFTESICDESNIKFGGCIASCLKVKIAGLDRDISGERFYAVHKIEGGDDVPYGYFTVDSAKLTNDSEHREIIAYDDIYSKLNKDVVEWYKSLAFPMPLKVFRQSLFSYIGIPIEEQELVNDNMIVEKTVDADYLNGVDVAKAIGEINGTFGLMGRGGKFKYIMLAGTGLYPAEDLYPSEDLFPAEATEQFGKVGYRETKYEEYSTAPIDCLKIRQQDGDVGAHSPQMGKWENPYIITGNFLVYGKNAAQLQEICDNIFNIIRGISYRPHTTKLNGLPYIEPGDSFTLEKKRDSIDSYIFSRTITGSQALVDTWQASGDMYLQNEVTANTEIQMLKGRSTIIEKSVEGIKVTVTDLEANTNSKFEQTANRITAEVASINKDMSSRFEITNNRITQEVIDINRDMSSRFQITNNAITAEVQRATGAEGQLSSKITQTASEIRSEVKNTTDGLSSRISQTANSINLSVNNGSSTAGLTITVEKEDGTTQTATGTINMTGLVTFTNLSTSGQTTINGANITTGIVKAERIEADKLKIKAANVTGTLTIGQLPSNVAELGDIPSEYDITTITENTISTTNIIARNLKVKSANITGTITADFVEASGIKAGTISGVSLNFTSHNAVFWTTDYGEWTCDSNAIYTGSRNIQIYTSGNARFEGTIYTDSVSANTGRFNDWCYSPDWTNGSDRRIKNTINYEDVERLSKIIDHLKPVTYYMNNDKKNKLRFGFIAQDVKRIIDNLYKGEQALYSYSKEDDLYSLSYNDVIAPLVAKVQYMQKEIDELRKISVN